MVLKQEGSLRSFGTNLMLQRVQLEQRNLESIKDASAPHTTWKSDPQTGEITRHETWSPNPRNPNGWDKVQAQI